MKQLAERLEQARVPSAALCGMPDCYKIKLKTCAKTSLPAGLMI